MKSKLGLHILFWLAYILLEILANYFHYRPDEWPKLLLDIAQYLPLIMLSTYFLYLWAIPRFMKDRNTLPLLLSFSALLALIYTGRYLWALYDFNLGGTRIDLLPWSKVVKSVIRDLGMVALMSGILFIKDWSQKEGELREIKRINAEQRLELVIQQLQPHFLFNTINNIYSLIQAGSKQGAESLLQLSDVLEYFLHTEVSQLVSWEKEKLLAQKYIELHRLKYRDRLDLQWEDHLDGETDFPPFVLICLLENAFKHGGFQSQRFQLIIRLSREEGRIVLAVENSVSDEEETLELKQRGNQLLKELLSLHFGAGYRLVSDRAAKSYSTKIIWNGKA